MLMIKRSEVLHLVRDRGRLQGESRTGGARHAQRDELDRPTWPAPKKQVTPMRSRTPLNIRAGCVFMVTPTSHPFEVVPIRSPARWCPIPFTGELRIRLRAAKLAAIMAFVAFVTQGALVDSTALLALAVLLGTLSFAAIIRERELNLGRLAWVTLFAVFAAYPMVMWNTHFQAGYFHGGMVLASFGIAIVFVRERLHRLVLATTIVLLAYYILGYAITRDAGAIFVGSSNRVSTLFLALAVFTFVLGRRRYDLPMAGTVFLVATSAGGAAGIASSLLLLVIVFLRDKRDMLYVGNPARPVLILFGALGLAAVASYGPVVLTGNSETSFNLRRVIQTDVRYEIISWYARENLTNSKLILGMPLKYSIPVHSESGELSTLDNLHNSYLDLHTKTGIFAFLFLGAICVRVFQLWRRDPYMAALMMVILIRAFSNTAFILPGRYNFAFYVFLIPLGLLLQPSGVARGGVRGLLLLASTDRPVAASDDGLR